MEGKSTCTSLMLVVLALAACASGQATSPVQPPSSESPPARTEPPPSVHGSPNLPGAPPPPDMVCFGYGPKWSVEFLNGEARYIGFNEPDQYFQGKFYWAPNDNDWSWHRQDDRNPPKGKFALTANVRKAACRDPVRKRTYPYSALVNLPQGDIVNGCCRELRPGEAPLSGHGLTPVPNSENPQPPQE